MPPLSRLRLATLDDLARQLRFAPAKAVRKQLERTAALAGEVEAGKTYPEDWVVFRVTGYRPKIENPSIIVGEALLADLSALAERLSDAAALTAADMPKGALSIGALCTRWNVSRKTIDRYRRRGLVAQRIRGKAGRIRLVFTEQAVKAFESRHTGVLAEAAAFDRIDQDTIARIVHRAARYRRAFAWSRDRTARRIAPRFNRGEETIRQVLIRHDERAAEPIFGDSSPLSARERRTIFRAWRCAIDIGDIAEHFGRSRASVHRVINERRAELLRHIDAPIPTPLDTDDPAAMESLLAPLAVRSGLAEPAETDARAFVAASQYDAPSDAETEHDLAAAYWLLRHRARAIAAALPRYNPPATKLDEAETMLRWAALLKVKLVRAERALILRTIEERLGRPMLDLDAASISRLHARAFAASIDAAERFDPFKGGRLASPISLALARVLAAPTPDSPAAAHPDGAITLPLTDWTTRVAPWQSWLDPDGRLRPALPRLPSADQPLLAARFGWLGDPPLTLNEIHSRLGVTPASFAHRFRRAIRSARESQI